MVLQSTLFACLFACVRVAREQKNVWVFVFMIFYFRNLRLNRYVCGVFAFCFEHKVAAAEQRVREFLEDQTQSALFRTQKLRAHTHTHTRTHTYTRT